MLDTNTFIVYLGPSGFFKTTIFVLLNGQPEDDAQ